MPKFSTATVNYNEVNPVDLTEANAFLAFQPTGAKITVDMEEHETSRQVMRVLNASAKHLGLKIYRIGANKTAVTFRIVKVRATRKTPAVGNSLKAQPVAIKK